MEPLEDRRLLSVSLPSGKGDWTFYLSSAESNLGKSGQAFFNYEASQGVSWIVVKAQDGTTTGDWGYSSTVVTEAHNAGLKIYAYAYVYGNYYSGSGEADELSTTLSIINSTKPDGFVIDAEVEYQSQPTEAAAYASGIKAAYPNLFLAYAPFPIISDHESYPYIQFGEYCDAVMPQAYFETGSGYTPASMLSEIDSQWSYWDNIWATGGYPGSVKPIIPICQAYNDQYFTDNGSDLIDFVNDFKNDSNPATSGGYQGVSFFDADYETSGMRTEIADASIGISPPTQVSPGNSSSPGPTVSGTSQTFTWDKVTNATSYLLQVTNTTTSTVTDYTISSGSTTSYTVSSLTPGDAYSWIVWSNYNSYQAGPWTTDYFKILSAARDSHGTECVGDGRAVDFRQLEHGQRRHQLHLGSLDVVRQRVCAGLLRLDRTVLRQWIAVRNRLLLRSQREQRLRGARRFRRRLRQRPSRACRQG